MGTIIHTFERILLSSLEATVMVSVLWLVSAVFRQKLAPIWKYSLWMLLVAKLLLPWLPGNLDSEFQWMRLDHIAGLSVATDPHANAAVYEPGMANETLPRVQDAQLGIPSELVTEQSSGSHLFIVMTQIAAILWLTGMVLTLLYIIIGHIRMSLTLAKENGGTVPIELEQQFAQLCRVSGIHSAIRLQATSVVDSPTLYGLISPVVLIPRRLIGRLSSTDWECVMRHELIHYRRFDIGVNVLFALLTAMHWFNPLIWYAAHRMRQEQEAACDAAVLAAVDGKKEAYARTIVTILETSSARNIVPTSIGFSSMKLKTARRIAMIRHFQPASKRVLLLGILIIVTVALFTLPSVFAEGSKDSLAANDPSQDSLPTIQEIDEQDVEVNQPTQSEEVIALVMPTTGPISREFGERIHPITLTIDRHDGIDIVNQSGTEVVAAAAGQVIKAAEYSVEKGFFVFIEHPGNLQTEYWHLSEITVREGDQVEANDRIGLMGSTGQSTGPHLHFAVMKDGEFIDPQSLLLIE